MEARSVHGGATEYDALAKFEGALGQSRQSPPFAVFIAISAPRRIQNTTVDTGMPGGARYI